MMTRWERFFRHIQQDIKVFAFTLAILCLFRALFLMLLSGYLRPDTETMEISKALFWGLRISLKSAGIIGLLTFLFCTLPSAISGRWSLDRLRLILGSIYATGLTLLFHASVPYYQAFHANFNQLMYNGLKDDTQALGVTLVQQYHLVPLLVSAIVVSAVLCRLLAAALRTGTFVFPVIHSPWGRYLARVAVVLLIPVVYVFVRFGGSINYAGSVHWENAAVLRDDLLNEAILDSVQALYRAYSTHIRIVEAAGLNVAPGDIAAYCERFSGGRIQSGNLEDYLRHDSRGPLIHKPRHVFVIIGETLAEWPTLDAYRNLNLAPGLRALAAESDSALIRPFLPAGSGTSYAMNAVVTGLPEVGLYPNYHPETYRSVYATSIAPQMKRLGYKTSFWYGGFSSWQNIRDFVLAQGFDHLYSASDVKSDYGGNAWGVEDKFLLAAVAAAQNDTEDTFSVILTTSNHPPYTVDLAREGFDREALRQALRQALPPDKRGDEEFITQLGHYWYMDQVIAGFVADVSKRYPDSLFLITGDHASRFSLENSPPLFAWASIPLLIHGQGIRQEMFAPNTAGSHLSMAPTLMELIAPAGFPYYSYVPSLTQDSWYGANDELMVTAQQIKRLSAPQGEATGLTGEPAPDFEAAEQDSKAAQALAWWRLQKGNSLTTKTAGQ